MRIVFSGDFAPLVPADKAGDVSFEGIRSVLESCAYHITDLECPVTSSENKIAKSGPHIKAEPGTAVHLNAAKVTGACLANNHIYDYGDKGILDTAALLEKAGIAYAGVYTSDNRTVKPIVLQSAGQKAIILNYCEHEFSVRDKGVSAVGFHPVDAYNDIQSFRDEADYIVVVYHGGNEYYNLPSPNLQKELRFLIDAGADAVICHHTHVFSGMEYYKAKPIVYGLGNFFFPYPDEPDSWHNGLLCVLELVDAPKAELHPIEQCRNGYSVTLHEGEKRDVILKEIEHLSGIITDSDALQQAWDEYVTSLQKGAIKNIMHMSKWQRLQIKLGKKPAEIVDESALLQTYLSYNCSAHHNIAVEVLKKNMKKG